MIFAQLILLATAAEDAGAAPIQSEGGSGVAAERSLAEFLGLEHLLGPGWPLQLASALVALLLAFVIYQVVRRGITLAARNNRGVAEFEYMLTRLLRWLYIPVAALFVLQQACVEVGNVWTLVSAGLAMVAIGLVAVWSMLSNICATFLIFATRLFRVGDEIEVLEPTAKEGLRGQAKDVSLLFTTIDHGDSVTRIPNNIFFQKATRVHRGAKGGTVEELEAGKIQART
jgi:small-conductance mechanosensitive channel